MTLIFSFDMKMKITALEDTGEKKTNSEMLKKKKQFSMGKGEGKKQNFSDKLSNTLIPRILAEKKKRRRWKESKFILKKYHTGAHPFS